MQTVTESIPLNDLVRLHQPIQEEIDAAVLDVVRSGRYVNGPNVTAFEAELATFLDVEPDCVVACSSGTDALLMALMALGVGPGDRVVVPTFTFASPAMAIARLGATPVFVDIDPLTYNLDVGALETLHDICGVIAVHLFGQSADMRPLQTLADRRGWFVIEDAAQAIGTRYERTLVGTIGDVGCFSFFPTKNLGALGDAGACVAKDSATAETLRHLRHHGSSTKYRHDRLGGNFRMDAIQAAVLRVKLRWLDAWNEKRRRIARRYLGVDELPDGHTYHRFVIESDARDALQVEMQNDGIETAVYYPEVLHAMPAFGSLRQETPHAKRATERALAVPLFPEMTDEEIDRVTEWIARR